MKTQEQIDARDRKELAQRKKQKNKKALKYGLLLTLLALFLASVTDEISSAIGVQVQSSVVTEFFVRPLNVPYNEAMAMFSTATTFSYGKSVFTLKYLYCRWRTPCVWQPGISVWLP